MKKPKVPMVLCNACGHLIPLVNTTPVDSQGMTLYLCHKHEAHTARNGRVEILDK